MAFRADEETSNGNEKAFSYLVSRNIDSDQRSKSKDALWEIIDEIGPRIGSYPIWHPLVSHDDNMGSPATSPSRKIGYLGLDHTVTFRSGFISCPYGNGEEIIQSVEKLPHNQDAWISAERLDVQFYNEGTTAILVKCNWGEPLEIGGLIRKRIAVPLMIEKSIAHWRQAQVAERWADMRPYFLGRPHGSRSSLFVGQETALAMKKAHMAMVESGMFGPLMMD